MRMDLEEAEELPLPLEPQLAEAVPLGRALLEWASDPAAVTRALADWTADHPDLLNTPSEVVLQMARAAMRLGDEDILARAVELCRAHGAGKVNQATHGTNRWVEGLAAGDHRSIEEAVAIFESADLLVYAADALADAAILAARAGVASDAEQRAIELCTRIGLHPVLGPLPETRWLARA